MKKFTLGLFVTIFLFSCQEESSVDVNEDIYKRKVRATELRPTDNGTDSNNNNAQNNVTTQQVPFDFGLSAVLGAGALAAIRTARKRRKEEANKA